jgi:Putative zinc-finger
MSHLDEGTLHALLDGELDLHEVKEIQAHIGSCAACGTRLREVKEFHGEADRLVSVLELPITPSRRTAPADAEPPPFGDSPVDRRRTPRNLPRTSGQVNEPPPLLLPESSGYQRGGLIRRMRWAALILVTVGAGYLATRMTRPSSYAFEGELVPVRLGDSTPVLSEEEASPASRGDAAGESLQAAKAEAPTTRPATPPAASTPAPVVPRRVAPRPEPAAPALAKDQAAAAPEDLLDEEAGLADAPVAGAAGAVAGAAAAQNRDQGGEADAQPNVREEAAVALRELDRERQVERAAAATAALDSARARDAAVRQTVAAPPAPRTPEQRSGVYLRIGLDEAAKQLGRPVHVIEGMSQMFMGLVLGRNSPGADATRPVVRVVYQDSQGRLIFLDQQRIRPGQPTAAPGAEPHWVQGEIALHLSGEVGPDILRNYRSRVR